MTQQNNTFNEDNKLLDRETLLKATGIVLKRERKKVNMSQIDLAKEAGLSKNTISNIEMGKISPTLETIFNIFANLQTDIEKYMKMVTIEYNHLKLVNELTKENNLL